MQNKHLICVLINKFCCQLRGAWSHQFLTRKKNISLDIPQRNFFCFQQKILLFVFGEDPAGWCKRPTFSVLLTIQVQLQWLTPYEKHTSNSIMIEYILKFKIPVSILSPVSREEGPSPKQKELIFMADEGRGTGKTKLQNIPSPIHSSFSCFTLVLLCRSNNILFFLPGSFSRIHTLSQT